MENLEQWITIISIVLVALNQIAALFGRPKIVNKINFLSKIFDVLEGNYGKAKNKGG